MNSEFLYQLSIGIPSGMQYEKGDMLNIRGNSPDQFEAALDAFNGVLAQKCADAATAIKAAYAAVSGIPGAQVVQESQQAPLPAGSSLGGGDRANQPPQQSGWGNGNQQQSRPQGGGQQQQQRPAQQQGGNRNGGSPHPEGKGCEMCGKTLEAKTTSGGKKVWRCPDWRWNNGNPNGHSNEFVN